MTTDRPEIREIITKAVCGSGTYKYQRFIDLEAPVSHKDIQVLGNFVSNADIETSSVVNHTKYGKCVQVRGHYNVHVWYANSQDTQAAKTTVTFIEHIPIKFYGGESKDLQPLVRIIEKPKCSKSYVKHLGDKIIIRVEIEQTLGTEIIGITTLKVKIASPEKANLKSVTGKELIPPQKYTPEYSKAEYSKPENSTPDQNYYLDLKCEEDLPEEDDDDFSYYYDGYNG